MADTHREGRQFTRIELPMQSAQEVTRVVSAGNRRARERSGEETEAQKYERLLKAMSSKERREAPADTTFTPSPADVAKATEKRIAKERKKSGKIDKPVVVDTDVKTGDTAKDTKSDEFRTLSPIATTRLRNAQTAFEKAPRGATKERARQAIGRSLQSGVPSSGSITRLACQSPGCDNSIDLVKGADVVCPGCLSAGDRSGAEYSDKPRNVVSTNTLGGRRERGSGGR